MNQQTHKSTQGRKAILIIVIASSVLVTGFFDYSCSWILGQKSKEDRRKAPERSADWRTYSNRELRFEIKYPEDIITLYTEGKKLVMIHSIPFEHPNFCDGTGTAPPLKKLTDFKVTLKVFTKTLREAVIATHGDYVTSNFLEGDKLKIVPHFIDKFEIASLKGYRITSGAEGCGWRQYYFPLDSKNTLFVTRYFFPELTPIIKGYQEYLKLSGVISPDEEEELFNRILSTFRFLE